jgi:plasmid replication initiation protein
MFPSLPDFSDISLRDYQETMQRPFFSLSKKRRSKPIEYLSPDKSVTVHVSANPAYGMATIWDADIMIYLASHLNELRTRGDNDLSPTISLQPGDLLKRICWGTSGRAYERLVSALDRLQAKTTKTDIRASSKSRETTFSWIDSYTHLIDEKTQRSLGMEITLSKWFFDGVDKRNVPAISPRYFEITSGLGKWLYRASRKHAGGNGAEGSTIGF